MTRQRLENRNIRKLTNTGRGSIGIVLPIEIIRSLKWRAKQKVVVTQRGQSIVIKDWAR